MDLFSLVHRGREKGMKKKTLKTSYLDVAMVKLCL